MDGRKQQGNATIKQKQNKNKTETKPPTQWVDVMAVVPTLPIGTWAR